MVEQFFYVLGYGFFGKKAVPKIQEEYGNEASIIVVDTEGGGDLSAENPPVRELFRGDAVNYLNSLAVGSVSADSWIVPAVPKHVAFEYLLHVLGKDVRFQMSRLPVPEDLEINLPFQLRSEEGTLYSSMARFRCPDDCEEPDEYCTATGEPREALLYQVLQEVRFEGYYSLVLRSRQIAPGVGGFQLRELFVLKDRLLQACSAGWESFLISTSCKCHAVTDGLQLRQRLHEQSAS